MVTIRTVAKHADVSIGTVSNVLTGKRPVSKEVRQRVLQAIEELGYHTDLVAQSLVTGRTGMIGTVITNFRIEGILFGIDLEATKKGYSLLVSKIDEGQNPVDQLQSMISRRVDGMIWCVPETDNSHQWLKDIKTMPRIPVVMAFCTAKPGYSTFWMDNFSGGYQAGQHLAQHGCRKIAHITGPIEHRESQERKAGWEAALAEASLETYRVAEGGWNMKEGWQAMRCILEKWPDVDAVFAAADMPAIGAISFLNRSGRKVPEEVKVIGFDDVIGLDYYHPALTTIHQDYEALGERLVRELSRRIQDPAAEPEAVVLPTHLVVRQSCGCPGAVA